MDVSAIMTRELVTATSNDTVGTALRLLEEQEIRHLPIVEHGRLLGMVSDRDLREYRLPVQEEHSHPEYAHRLLATPVKEVMNEELITLEPTESLAAAVDLMIQYAVGAIPVVRDDKLVGILSYVDVLRALRPSLDGTDEDPE